MAHVTRRDTLRFGGSAFATLALPSCAGSPKTYPPAPNTGPLIDAHCHIFNGTDLPITTFLTRLAVPKYDPQTCDIRDDQDLRSFGTIDDPNGLETLIELFVGILLSATPTAKEELARLERGQNGTIESETARVRARALNGLAEFLDEPRLAEPSLRVQRRTTLRETLWHEATQATGLREMSRMTSRQAATRLLDGSGRSKDLFNWVKLFFRSRESLATELISASRHWGRDPLMLIPLMVDYTHWLGQTTDCNSTLPDQVAVYGALARRSHVPIHAMVPYDPLRAVFWQSGKHDRFPTPEFDPLDLARRAVTDHGFVGLKLYPPMGFQASGNSNKDEDYPDLVIKALQPKGTLGTKLDQAMLRAIDLCIELDVPMLAHANNTLAAGKGYGRRADPHFWIKVLERKPGLRLCLAHAGHFCWQEADPPTNTPNRRTSWEWAIGRYLQDHPDSHLYIDISYFSEALGSATKLGYIADQLRDWIKDCDQDVRHILYGSDWTMLGKEPGFAGYGKTVIDFLRTSLDLSDAQVERVMWQNAMRYLGLDNGQSRDRLLAFYNGRRPPWTMLELPPNP